MPPKKREKDSETNKNSKIDHLQADHELFLQAFESKSRSIVNTNSVLLRIAHTLLFKSFSLFQNQHKYTDFCGRATCYRLVN